MASVSPMSKMTPALEHAQRGMSMIRVLALTCPRKGMSLAQENEPISSIHRPSLKPRRKVG